MNTLTKVMFGPLLFAGLSACAVLPKNEIVTQATINAEPATVWSVLVDTESYSEWNPFIVDVEGRMAAGERIVTTMEATPGDPQIFRPKLLIVEQNKELRWLGRAGLPGFFDAEHYILLEPENGATRLIHGETFSGIGLWFVDTDAFEMNLRQMNDALEARVEALENEREAAAE